MEITWRAGKTDVGNLVSFFVFVLCCNEFMYSIVETLFMARLGDNRAGGGNICGGVTALSRKFVSFCRFSLALCRLSNPENESYSFSNRIIEFLAHIFGDPARIDQALERGCRYHTI